MSRHRSLRRSDLHTKVLTWFPRVVPVQLKTVGRVCSYQVWPIDTSFKRSSSLTKSVLAFDYGGSDENGLGIVKAQRCLHAPWQLSSTCLKKIGVVSTWKNLYKCLLRHSGEGSTTMTRSEEKRIWNICGSRKHEGPHIASPSDLDERIFNKNRIGCL